MKRIALTHAALTLTGVFLTAIFTAVASRTVNASMCPTQTEIDTVTLINQERQNNGGLPPLMIDLRLVEAARLHSLDMATNNFFSHTGSDGSQFWQRIQWAGYFFSWASENIAAGYATPADVVDGWMNSPGHRANILDTNVTEIGLGYIFDPSDAPLPGYPFPFYSYWTTDFGKSANGVVTGPCDYADFSAMPTSGSAPLSVSFTDQTLVRPRSWSWDFGDGSTSTLQNPVHIYSSDGNFTVTLTIAVWGISDSIVKTGYINVMSCDAQARVASQPFGTIQLAYDHANNLDSVDARAMDFRENLTFGNDASVIFRGGFDCDYDSNLNRYTSVNGSLTIGGTGSGTGEVVVENIILR